MKRLIIRHCQDAAVLVGWRWDLWCVDTHDPYAEPLFVGWGSWQACTAIARRLIGMNRVQGELLNKFHFAGFQCPASSMTRSQND